jgi:hypothetical protein
MAEPLDRKAARRAWKERRVRAGIYAVRHRTSGQAWAGAAQDLDTTRNGLWHTLEDGRHLDRDLQAAWDRWGSGAFDYEILEVLPDDLTPLVLRETLKERRAAWAGRLARDR